MQTIKNLMVAIAILAMVLVSKTQAQIAITPPSIPIGGGGGSSGGGGSGSSNNNIALPFDPSAVTNRAELASLAIRNVDHIMVRINQQTDASLGVNYGEGQTFMFPFNDPVKSFSAMTDMIGNISFGIEVVDPTKPAYVTVSFCKGVPTDYYYGNSPTFQTLIYGQNNNGTLEEWKAGYYILTPESSVIQMRLNHNVRMNFPGLIAGKVIHTRGDNDYSYSSPINNVNSNGDFDLPVDDVGTGTLVLFGRFDGEYKTIAISLVSAQRVPLTEVLIRVLLAGSEQIIPFSDPSEINVLTDSWNGYGVNPLIVVKMPSWNCPREFTCSRNVPVRVSTREGILPRGYKLLNIKTGQETTITLPAGANSVTIPFSSDSEYHLIPDLQVKGVPPQKG